MKKNNDIDKLFKEGLENPDIPYNELNWEELEEKLHPATKRKITPFFWAAAAAGVAAMLLIVFMVINNSENNLTNTIANQSIKSDKETNSSIDSTEKEFTKINPLQKTANSKTIKKINNEAGIKEQNADINGNLYQETRLAQTSELLNINLNKLILNLPENKIMVMDSVGAITYKNQKINTEIASTKPFTTFKKAIKTKPSLVLGFTAAPDLTSVQKSGRSSLSGGIGIDATLILTRRLSITTGVAFAKKIYDSDFNLYTPQSNYVFKNQPTNIHANCDVIDIPLNVNYKILGNNRNSLTLSTGLSSYLMLKEAYYYAYETAYTKGPQSYEVKNQNQHVFGIANIGATFQHKVNNKLSIGITPFVKIPLTNIGYGNYKLSSTGVAVSVNMIDLFHKK